MKSTDLPRRAAREWPARSDIIDSNITQLWLVGSAGTPHKSPPLPRASIKMTEPITQYPLTTFVEPAPSPSDPPDAPDVYRALGVAMVAWARLEGRFTLTTIALLNLGPRKRKKFPMKWEGQVAVWREALSTVPQLAGLRGVARAIPLENGRARGAPTFDRTQQLGSVPKGIAGRNRRNKGPSATEDGRWPASRQNHFHRCEILASFQSGLISSISN